MSESQGILVLGELHGQSLASESLEALAAARQLAAALPGEPVAMLLAGSTMETAASQAIAHGADTIYMVVNPLLDGQPVELMLAAVHEAVKTASPRFVLGAKTMLGADVLPRLAFRLGGALAQDCVALSIDAQQRLLATRPVYGGNALATVACTYTPSVAALRPRVFEALPADPARTGQVVPLTVKLDASMIKAKRVERIESKTEGVRLEDAKVIIGGGRGIGGAEGFKQLEAAAALLHGAVGASRAVCDAGWAPAHCQIGLTGKSVSPELYIAVGISGASQHLAGCSGAKVIVAINQDPKANIFKSARYGVAGDWRKVLPAFVDQVHELVS